jgi:hypothetical protein
MLKKVYEAYLDFKKACELGDEKGCKSIKNTLPPEKKK